MPDFRSTLALVIFMESLGTNGMFSDQKIAILWLLPILFFFIMSFILLILLQPGISLIYMIIPFAFTSGITVLAWFIYAKHYTKINFRPFYLPTLVFVLLTFVFVIIFEAAFNASRLFEPGFIESHFQYHIFNETIVFIIMFVLMWLGFQKFIIGKQTLLVAYILGVIFEIFFAGESGNGLAGIITGFLWIWIFHVNWFITSPLIRAKY